MSKPDGPVDAPCSDHTADGSVRAAFLREYVSVPVDAIVPLKVLRDGISESRKYAQIVSSIKAIGLVEPRSEEHTSELQSLMRISYAVFCLKKKNKKQQTRQIQTKSQNHQIK